VLCAGGRTGGVLSELRPFLVSLGRSCCAFSQLWLYSQNDKKCDNFEELALVIQTLNLLKVYVLIWSHICCVKPYRHFRLPQTAKLHWDIMSVWSIYHRKGCKSQTWCFDTLHHIISSWGQNWTKLSGLHPLWCELMQPEPDIWDIKKIYSLLQQ
jgi:hypothetical protein